MRKGTFQLVAMLALFATGARADFSSSQVMLHPEFPGDGPFIVEIRGTWPSDCHPGEQRPFVESWDGGTLVIEFEIVVVHVTCNDTDTTYQSLVDMSELVEATPATGDSINVKVNYQDAAREQTLSLACGAGGCPASLRDTGLPERGLFYTPGRAKEGLLIARQNDIAAIYPLVYDESGTAEWLFSVGRVSDGSYFADLYRFAGGDCFGCEPTATEPEMTQIGTLSILFDLPGKAQVQIDDQPFTTYQKLVYSHDIFPSRQPGIPDLVGLDGRWALSENKGTPPHGNLAEHLPGAFDITFQTVVPDPQSGLEAGQVYYLVTSMAGQELGQLVCEGESGFLIPRTRCDFIDPTDGLEPLFLFFQDGPNTITIEYGRAVLAVGIPPSGKAVRLN